MQKQKVLFRALNVIQDSLQKKKDLTNAPLVLVVIHNLEKHNPNVYLAILEPTPQ